MSELKNDRVANVFEAIATRLSQEPDLDHFLGWLGGTLEYWIEIVTAATGKRFGWTAHSEIPYVTDCPAAKRQGPLKWADGVVIADDGWVVLLEIKTVPMKEILEKKTLGKAMKQVPEDFGALLAIDWPATRDQDSPYGPADTYTDPQWWSQRKSVRELWGLNLLLVHGRFPLVDVERHVREGIGRGIRSLQTRVENKFADHLPTWMDLLQSTMSATHYRYELRGQQCAGVLLGWAKVLPLVREVQEMEGLARAKTG